MFRVATSAVCLAFAIASVAYAASGPRVGVGWTPYSDVNSISAGAAVYLWDYAHTGYDSTESRYTYDTWDDSTTRVYSWFRRDSGVDGWDGQSGWYHDQALPVPSFGSSTVAKGLYVWAEPSFAYDTFNIGYLDEGFPHPEEWIRTLRLVKVPDGISYSGPREWMMPLYTNKVAAFLPSAVIPAYKTDDPFTGYEFEIEIQHLVPEPSSVIALICGLIGICRIGLRRRRA